MKILDGEHNQIKKNLWGACFYNLSPKTKI